MSKDGFLLDQMDQEQMGFHISKATSDLMRRVQDRFGNDDTDRHIFITFT